MKKFLLIALLIMIPVTALAGEVIFSPFLFDRFGVGTSGIPGRYGYDSYGSNGYRSAGHGPGAYGVGLDDYTRAYEVRPDVVLDQSDRHVKDAQALAEAAKAQDAELRKFYLRNQVRKEQIKAAGDAISKVVPPVVDRGLSDAANQANLVIRTHCYDCHGNGRKRGGVSLESFLKKDCGELQDILVSVTRHDTADAPRMPLDMDPLLPEEIAAIRAYVNKVCSGDTPDPTPDSGTPDKSDANAIAEATIILLQPRLDGLKKEIFKDTKAYIDARIQGTPAKDAPKPTYYWQLKE